MSSVVPEGWEVKRLGELCNSVRGVSYKPDDLYSIKSDSTATLLRSNNIQSGQLIFNNVQFVDRRKVKERQIVRTGDIAICMSNGSKRLVGKNGIFPQTHQSDILTVGAFCSIIRTKEGGNETFISQVLKSDEFFKQVELSLAGSAINNLKDGDVEDYLFSFPPLPEQKKIASILTSVDEVIENTQKQIDKLQDLKKATMNELLTKGIGHTEFKDSEFGRIPKSWEVGSLSNLITIKHGYAFEGAFFTSTPNGITLLTPGNFHRDGHLYFGSKTKYYTGEIPKDYILSNGDLLVVMTDLTAEMTILGNTLILSATNIILHNQRIGKIVFSDEDFHLGFLNLIMNSRYVKKFVKLNATGTTVRHTSPTKIMDCDVPIPSLSEQTRIASIISCIQENIEKQQEKLSQTQSLKKSLMQDLLTGKVRVTVN